MRTEEKRSLSESSAALEAKWRHLGVHRASRAARPATWSTGWPDLDRILPGGGYPLAAVTEWLVAHPGSGELSLLLAGLAPRLKAHPDHRLVLLNPPHGLSAPALDAAGIDRARLPVIQCRRPGECIWSVEQLAEAGGFVGFVLWQDRLAIAESRRLQLASEKAGCPMFVYRDLKHASERSPAALRLALTLQDGRQRLDVRKCRGPAGACTNGLWLGHDGLWAMSRPCHETIDRAGPISAPANEETPDDNQTATTARRPRPPLSDRSLWPLRGGDARQPLARPMPVAPPTVDPR